MMGKFGTGDGWKKGGGKGVKAGGLGPKGY